MASRHTGCPATQGWTLDLFQVSIQVPIETLAAHAETSSIGLFCRSRTIVRRILDSNIQDRAR
jgi:hypothetical protein